MYSNHQKQPARRISSGYTFFIWFNCKQNITVSSFIMINFPVWPHSNFKCFRQDYQTQKACKLCTVKVSLVLLLLTSLGRILHSQSKCQAAWLKPHLRCYFFCFCHEFDLVNQKINFFGGFDLVNTSPVDHHCSKFPIRLCFILFILLF